MRCCGVIEVVRHWVLGSRRSVVTGVVSLGLWGHWSCGDIGVTGVAVVVGCWGCWYAGVMGSLGLWGLARLNYGQP